MTFEQWWLDLTDPSHLLTESVYNIGFELLATYVFVRFALKGIVTKIMKDKQDEESL